MNDNNNEPMTAEQRLRDFFDYPDGPLEGCDHAVYAEQIVKLMDEHTAAAVEASWRCIAELERQRNSARQEVMRLQQCRSALDCSYAGAFGESDGASHCPPERPCQRCMLERERDDARVERDCEQERAQVDADLREKSERRIAELERERAAAWDERNKIAGDFAATRTWGRCGTCHSPRKALGLRCWDCGRGDVDAAFGVQAEHRNAIVRGANEALDRAQKAEARIVELTRERDEARAIAAEFMHKQTAEIERNRMRAPWIDDEKGGE